MPFRTDAGFFVGLVLGLVSLVCLQYSLLAFSLELANLLAASLGGLAIATLLLWDRFDEVEE